VSAEEWIINKEPISERQNNVVSSFDPKRPRASAFDIHEWIYEQLHVPENAVNMVQIEGPRRQVYINFPELQCFQKVLHSTTGQSEYKHDNGEISQVKIEMAGMGAKRVRLLNLLPEIPDEAVRFVFSNCGEIKEIQEERWSRAYRNSVANGARIVVIAIKKHIPSHMTVARNRVYHMKGSPRRALVVAKRDIYTRFAPSGEEWESQRPKSPQHHGSTLQ